MEMVTFGWRAEADEEASLGEPGGRAFHVQGTVRSESKAEACLECAWNSREARTAAPLPTPQPPTPAGEEESRRRGSEGQWKGRAGAIMEGLVGHHKEGGPLSNKRWNQSAFSILSRGLPTPTPSPAAVTLVSPFQRPGEQWRLFEALGGSQLICQPISPMLA